MWKEADRLTALKHYDILDTPATEVFDDFVRIAAEVCGTPIALVSFVDEARQWFAAETGLGVSQTPLSESVCAHALRQDGVFVVPDLTLDDRFSANLLVTGSPHLRFYGGAILRTSEGFPLGTVCVLDQKPRPEGLSDRQKSTLQALARQVMAQLELRLALRQRTEAFAAKDAMVDEMKTLLAEKNTILAEKDLLMQEIHHRVKNSLSTVQSLLRLQARASTDGEVARQLQESAGRIRTFSAIHEQLYLVGAASQVDLAVYLQSLVDDQRVASAYGPNGRTIGFTATSMLWPSAEAPTLGLILVELVTNALKYGVGAITVTLHRHGEAAVLTVEDEGSDLPPNFDPLQGDGLGMRIVTGLLKSHQRGRLEIDRTRGHTCFIATVTGTSPYPI